MATGSSAVVNFFIGPRSPGPIYVSGCLKLTKRRCLNLTDVTLADEDTNSILTDKVNRTIHGNTRHRKMFANGMLGTCLQLAGGSLLLQLVERT